MSYTQLINNEVSITDGVQSFIHIDDEIETAIQSLSYESGSYNVVDDDTVKRNYCAAWYANLLNVTPHTNIKAAAPYERGVSNEKFKRQGGKLTYKTWKVGMNPIN